MEHHSGMSVAGRFNRATGAFAKVLRAEIRQDFGAKSADQQCRFADEVQPLYADAIERVSGFLGSTPVTVLLAASAAGLAIGAFLTDYQ